MCTICGDNTHKDDLDDNFDDLFGTGSNVTPIDTDFAKQALRRAVADPVRAATFEEPCKKCHGRGKFVSYTGRIVGDCFTCKGTGKQVFKTSAETRQKAADAKLARHLEKINEWCKAHPAEIKWLGEASTRGFNFATDMLTGLGKYGDLNEFKLAKVREFMAKDAARAAEKAEIAARAPDITGASLDKIENAFATAIGNQIKFPKLRLDTFIFSKVMSGQNAGAIYVKSIERDENDERRYLGKIVDGRFVRAYGTSPEEEQRIIAAAMDPAAAAKAYGQRTGTCSICGRELTRAESIDRAMGPICADRYGW